MGEGKVAEEGEGNWTGKVCGEVWNVWEYRACNTPRISTTQRGLSRMSQEGDRYALDEMKQKHRTRPLLRCHCP